MKHDCFIHIHIEHAPHLSIFTWVHHEHSSTIGWLKLIWQIGYSKWWPASLDLTQTQPEPQPEQIFTKNADCSANSASSGYPVKSVSSVKITNEFCFLIEKTICTKKFTSVFTKTVFILHYFIFLNNNNNNIVSDNETAPLWLITLVFTSNIFAWFKTKPAEHYLVKVISNNMLISITYQSWFICWVQVKLIMY